MKIFLTLLLTCFCASAQQTRFYPLNPATSLVSTGSVPFTVPYPAAATDPTLDAEYLFNGNANDALGLHNGSLAVTGVYTNDKNGTASSALVLDGTSQYVNCGTGVGNYTNSNFTISWWGYAFSLSSESIWFSNDGYPNTGYDIEYLSSDLSLRTMNGSPHGSKWLTYPSDSAWHSFATVVYAGTTSTNYLDGVAMTQDGPATTVNFTSPVNPFTIGRYAQSSFGPMHAFVDDVRLYHVAKTPSQISDINAKGPDVPSGL